MKICAVISEFNPFHNGHKYLLEMARVKSGCDAILCVMSGNFVQRAEPSCIPRELKTEFALKNGADFVVEIPFLYATASAELFAKGAIEIISQLKNVTHLAFGCENENISHLKTIAQIQAIETADFKNMLSLNLKQGMSYPNAYSKTTSFFAQKSGIDSIMCDVILSKPNNLLAIEYIKQLINQKVHAHPIPILRKGSNYNDKQINENYSSATAIRNCILNNEYAQIQTNVPSNTFDDLVTHSKRLEISEDSFSTLLIYALRNYPLENLLDASEGIENKLRQNAFLFSKLNEILAASKTKRYTYARLKRLCIQALFSITKSDIKNAPISPLKLLGVKNDFKDKIKDVSSDLIIKTKDYDNLNKELYNRYFQTEEKAASIYSQIRQSIGGNLYSYKLVIV